MAARWRALSRVALLMLATVAFVVFAQAAFAETSTIAGAVTSFVDASALPAAHVELWKYDVTIDDYSLVTSTTADAVGQYSFDALEPGGYFVGASADGFVEHWTQQDVLGTEGAPIIVNFAMYPDVPLISGAVAHAGTGVEGIEVTAFRYDGFDWYDCGWTRTDAAGNYSFLTSDFSDASSAEGSYRVGVGYSTTDVNGVPYFAAFWNGATSAAAGDDVTTSFAAPATEVNLDSAPMPRIAQGIITDALSGAPITGAWAWINNANWSSEFVTAADGSYVLYGDPTGLADFTLAASHYGHVTSAAAISYAGSAQTVDFALDRASKDVQGTVTDPATGLPVEAWIQVDYYETSAATWYYWGGVDTDADGKYVLYGLDPGVKYRLTAYSSAGAYSSSAVSPIFTADGALRTYDFQLSSSVPKPDVYESDDSTTTHGHIVVNDPMQKHTFAPGGDRDFIELDVTAGTIYDIDTHDLGEYACDTYLYLLDVDGTEITKDDDGGPGVYSHIHWQATETKTVYIMVREYYDDGLGAYGITVRDDTVVADTTAPVLTALVDQANPTRVVLSASAVDDSLLASRISFSVNGDTWRPYEDPEVFSAPGGYQVEVVATDQWGNSSTPQVFNFTVASPPDTNGPSIDAQAYNDGSATVRVVASAWDDTDPAPSITYKVNGGASQPYGAPVDFTTPGHYTVMVEAVDASSNKSTKTVEFAVADTTKPVFTASTAVVGDGSPAATVTVGASDDSVDPVTITYTVNGGDAKTYTGPVSVKKPGNYTIVATATDGSGNSETKTLVFVVTDVTSPELSAVVSGDGTAKATLTLSATDDSGIAPAIAYTVNGGTKQTYAVPIDFTTPGSYSVKVSATDGSNNTADKTVIFSVKYPAAADRLGGANRYDVAINLARTLKSSLAFTDVIVACGEDRASADPLGAAALAAAYECPVLLTPTAKVNAGTVATIKAMAAANGGKINIHVVGGATSIPKTVYNAIAAARGAGTCERINGANRYALAYQIAARTKAVLESKGKSVPGVIVVNIENASSFNDALAASPVSARAHLPLIGVKGASVPGEAAAALSLFPGKPRYALNSAYLTPAVRNATGCTSVVAGSANREVAAVDIAKWGVANGFVSYKNVGLANKLSDALPAGAVLGQLNGVMLYSGISPLSSTTGSFLPVIKTGVDKGWVFGGTATIADSTKASFFNALQ